MSRVALVHWNAAEAEERAERLRKAGHEVETVFEQGGEAFREFRADPPEVFVIDLTRLPSHGRVVGIFLRQQKSMRHVPIVFVDGEPEKVERARADLPDAVYTEWRRLRGAITKAIKRPPDKPVVPPTPGFYSKTPLVKKLGIEGGAVVALLGSPHGFEKTLAKLPKGVRLKKQARGQAELTVLFARTLADLRRRFGSAARVVPEGNAMWVAWPKKSSGVQSDLTQVVVRRFAESEGWVDFKICSIDDTWSGLKFTRREQGPKR